MLLGLSHITLIVKDLERTSLFLNKIFGAEEFQIQDEDFDDYISKIKSVGAEIKTGRSRVKGEGRSIYLKPADGLFISIPFISGYISIRRLLLRPASQKWELSLFSSEKRYKAQSERLR